MAFLFLIAMFDNYITRVIFVSFIKYQLNGTPVLVIFPQDCNSHLNYSLSSTNFACIKRKWLVPCFWHLCNDGVLKTTINKSEHSFPTPSQAQLKRLNYLLSMSPSYLLTLFLGVVVLLTTQCVADSYHKPPFYKPKPPKVPKLPPKPRVRA